MLDPVVAAALSLAFAVLFGAGAYDKLANVIRFRAVLADYRMLPPSSIAAAGIGIGLIELALAVGWLSRWLPLWTAAASAVLFIGYAGAMAANLVRGRREVSCGCVFGAAHAGDRLSWSLVIRNGVLAALALLPALPLTARVPDWADHAVATVAAVALLLIYLAGQQLMGNAAAMRAWRAEPGR
ncbi:MAG: MauE/DoxX family redox-associated membrane protein [Pseudomonadales bacterium]